VDEAETNKEDRDNLSVFVPHKLLLTFKRIGVI
jgi:hypothetical protein